MVKCAFPRGTRPCGKTATHEYKKNGDWRPCCESHTKASKKLGFEVRKIAD